MSTVQNWLQSGFQAQQAGDLARAKAAYEQVLRVEPDHPDACQLMGQLARRSGDEAGAEAWLRRSLASREAQPHVWNNLGNLLLATERGDEALQAYEHALRLKPDYADAHYNRARALHAAQRLAEAADALNAALRHNASGLTVPMLQLHAQIEGDAGHIESALRTLSRAIEAAPDRAALWHNRAVLLQRRHRFAEALVAHDKAAALGADAADAQYNRGNTLQSLGRHDAALAAYRGALQRVPQHALALYDLARLRWRLGDADFDAELRQAIAADPRSPAAAGILGHLLWRAERYEDSAAAYRQALHRAPDSPGLLDGLGRSLVRVGEIETGLAALRQACTLAPADAEIRSNHATSLLVAGRFDTALHEAEAACVLAPLHQQAQALRGLALRMLGDPRAAWLDDADSLVRIVDLTPPPGWSDMAQFNAALAEELDGLHHDRHHPVDQTLRGGTQTLGDIFEQGYPLVDALKARIAQAVTETIADLPDEPTHPFLFRRPVEPGAWRFTDSWSNRLGRQGYHTDHVHPHGWISSAYYVKLPPAVADPVRRQGWIRFGVPDFPVHGVDPASLARRVEQPAVGRLVLFPSMMWHGTTRFDDDAVRLTVAFDVVPT
jgi:tetratricopeptide (TPR) repeat protein